MNAYTPLQRTTIFTLANAITSLRIFLTPLIVYLMYIHAWKEALLVFTLAASTDVLDGFIARIRNEQTVFGACLDPVADKILLTSCFCTLWYIQAAVLYIPGWFVYGLAIKELCLIVGTIALYASGNFIRIEPTQLGKIGTFLQLCFIAWLLWCSFFQIPQDTALICMLFFILIVLTLMQYVWITCKKIQRL